MAPPSLAPPRCTGGSSSTWCTHNTFRRGRPQFRARVPNVNQGEESSRRGPRQQRSRERMQQILTATEDLLATEGMAAMTPAKVAKAAGVPVSSLYTYFDDVESIVIAIARSHAPNLVASIETRLLAIANPTIETLVRASLQAWTEAFQGRPGLVEALVRNPEALPRVAEQRRRGHEVAAEQCLRMYRHLGLVDDRFTEEQARFVVEMGSRMMQMAHIGDTVDPKVVEEAVLMITRYLAAYAPASDGLDPA
jgi:AcrR family transcriptional regulator